MLVCLRQLAAEIGPQLETSAARETGPAGASSAAEPRVSSVRRQWDLRAEEGRAWLSTRFEALLDEHVRPRVVESAQALWQTLANVDSEATAPIDDVGVVFPGGEYLERSLASLLETTLSGPMFLVPSVAILVSQVAFPNRTRVASQVASAFARRLEEQGPRLAATAASEVSTWLRHGRNAVVSSIDEKFSEHITEEHHRLVTERATNTALREALERLANELDESDSRLAKLLGEFGTPS